MKIQAYATGHGNYFHFLDQDQNDLGYMSIEEFIQKAPSLGIKDVTKAETALRAFAMQSSKPGVWPLDIDTDSPDLAANDLLSTGSGSDGATAVKIALQNMPIPSRVGDQSTTKGFVPESREWTVFDLIQEAAKKNLSPDQAAFILLERESEDEEKKKWKETYRKARVDYRVESDRMRHGMEPMRVGIERKSAV